MKRWLLHITLSALSGFMLYALFVTYAPIIEGKFFPVVKNTKITIVVQESLRTTIITGESYRIRDCDFRGLEIYKEGVSGGASLVPLEILEPTKTRGLGLFTFGPWRVGLTADEIASLGYSIAYHRCHPFYLTQSRFYP